VHELQHGVVAVKSKLGKDAGFVTGAVAYHIVASLSHDEEQELPRLSKDDSSQS
jgi:hypothetical protein